MTTRIDAGDTVDVTVEAIGDRGDGIADLGGKRVFVPYAVPGDRVRVRLGSRRGDGYAAQPVERLADGPGRATPACRHFGDCGGCALQHLDEEAYAAWKRERVVSALARRGLGDVPVATLVPTPPGDRRRAAFVASRRRDGLRLGFHARASRRVVDVAVCPVLRPALAALLTPLRALLAELLAPDRTAVVSVNDTENGPDLVLALGRAPGLADRERLAAFAEAQDLARVSWREAGTDAPEPIVQRRPVRMVFAGVAVDPPPAAFLQPSATGEAALVAEVCAAAGDSGRVADLFAGCGTFSLALARSAAVHAVEGDPAMAAALGNAAARAGLSGRLSVEARDLGRRPLGSEELARFDACVFDPPRAGARRQVEALAASGIATIVAVSCNPASFARDARILVDGGYRLARVTPLDQFLWSPHVELVAVFRKI